MHPAFRTSDRPVQHPSANTLTLIAVCLNTPVIQSRKLFQLPSEQTAVEIHELGRIFGVNFEVCDVVGQKAPLSGAKLEFPQIAFMKSTAGGVETVPHWKSETQQSEL